MSSDLNRRGLLGLMAAAPVAAVAKAAATAVECMGLKSSAPRMIADDFVLAPTSWRATSEEMWITIEDPICGGGGGEWRCSATLLDNSVNDFNTLATCQEPPPGGLLSAGHGPDAAHNTRSPIIPPGCDHVAPDAASGLSLSLDSQERSVPQTGEGHVMWLVIDPEDLAFLIGILACALTALIAIGATLQWRRSPTEKMLRKHFGGV